MSHHGHALLQLYDGPALVQYYDLRHTAALDEWTHYALTLDGAGGVAFYVDGGAVFARPGRGLVAANATRTHTYLGRAWWNSDALYNGSLADFQFGLGAVFSADDVANLALGRGCPQPPPPPGPPLASDG